MTRRAINLALVRDARRRLQELAHQHPEAFDPERLPTTPRQLMQAIKRVGRPPAQDPTIAVPTRLPRSMVAALDDILRERQAADPAVTRQDLMREAVRRFLDAERRKARRTVGGSTPCCVADAD